MDFNRQDPIPTDIDGVFDVRPGDPDLNDFYVSAILDGALAPKPRKVAVVSLHPSLHTGYSRVCRELIGIERGLASQGWWISLFATGVNITSYVGHTVPCPLDYYAPIDKFHPGTAQILYNFVSRMGADAIVTIGDLWDTPFMPNLMEALRADGLKTRWIALTAVDGEPVGQPLMAHIYGADAVVVPSPFGKDVLKRADCQSPVHVVPYGLSDAFAKYPTDDERTAARAALRAEVGMDDDTAPLLLAVSMNIVRKNLISTIAGFEYWASRNCPHARLAVVTDDPYAPHCDLSLLMDWHNIDRKRLFFAPNVGVHDCMPDEELRRYYLGADLLVTSTMGEGFCFPVHEALAQGLPVLGPMTTSLRPILRHMPEWLEIEATNSIHGDWSMERTVVTPGDVSDALSEWHSAMDTPSARWELRRAVVTARAQIETRWAPLVTTVGRLLEGDAV